MDVEFFTFILPTGPGRVACTAKYAIILKNKIHKSWSLIFEKFYDKDYPIIKRSLQQ